MKNISILTTLAVAFLGLSDKYSFCAESKLARAVLVPVGWRFGGQLAMTGIKKLIKLKLTGVPQNLGVDPFPDPIGHSDFYHH